MKTSLQTANEKEIKAILDRKVDEIGYQRTVDYIAHTFSLIDAEVSLIDEEVSELKLVKEKLKDQSELIGVEVASWLNDVGVERLEGLRTSSITVYKRKPNRTFIIENEESVINAGYYKMEIDKTSAKKAVDEGFEIEGCRIEQDERLDTIKINKKRFKDVDNETVQ